MTPKATYLLNGERKTVMFHPQAYTLFTPEWERDEIEYKHPFTGEKYRAVRGWYIKATIEFEGLEYDQLQNKYRDLFNIATEDIRFYPNADTQDFYRVDLNESLSMEDAHAFLAYHNFQLVFRGRDRFDSPLIYTSLYWGARKTVFVDSQYLEQIRQELMQEQLNNFNLWQQYISEYASHQHGFHYTKSEIDTKINLIPLRNNYSFALALGGGPVTYDVLIQSGSGNAKLNNNCAMPDFIPAQRTAAISKIIIYAKNSETDFTHTANSGDTLTAGALFSVETRIAKEGGNYLVRIYLNANGVLSHICTLPQNFALPLTINAEILQ